MKIGFMLNMFMDDIHKIQSGKMGDYFLLELIPKMLKEGNEVVLITLQRQLDQDFQCESIPYLRFYGVKPLKVGRISAALGFRCEIEKVKRILKKEKCDIVHVNWCYEYAEAALEVNPHNCIITLHDWPNIVCPLIGNFYWKKRQKLGNKVLKSGRVFTAVSPYIEGMYRNTYDGEIRCIPNFVSSSIACPLELKKRMNTSNTSKKIISINNGFNDIKNVKKLIMAFEEVRNIVPDCELHLYGNGYESNGIANQWAQENSKTEGIFFHGQKDRNTVIQALRTSDVLVHPSVEESFGMTLIEAMANKTIVIAGKNSGAVPWVLGQGKYGILTDVNNSHDIAEAIIRFFANLQEMKEIADNAYDYVAREFSIEKVAERYNSMYKEIYVKKQRD